MQDFESVLVPQDNGKQNPEESYTNNKTYLRERAVYNFITSMIRKSKYCSDVIKIILTKNL